MRIPGADEAIEHLARWAGRGRWKEECMDAIAAHFEPVCAKSGITYYLVWCAALAGGRRVVSAPGVLASGSPLGANRTQCTTRGDRQLFLASDEASFVTGCSPGGWRIPGALETEGQTSGLLVIP